MAQQFVVLVLVAETCGYESPAGYLAAASIHQVKTRGHQRDSTPPSATRHDPVMIFRDALNLLHDCLMISRDAP